MPSESAFLVRYFPGSFSSLFVAILVLALEAVASFAFDGYGLGDFQECLGCMRKIGVFAVDEAQLALELKLANRDSHELAASDFSFDADLRDQSDSISHRNELLDGLQRGELEVHVQWRLVALEQLNDFLAIGRGDDVGDEGFCSQLTDADLRRGRERMRRRDDEYKFVKKDDYRVQGSFLRFVREHSEFDVVAENIIGYVATESALNRDFDHGMDAAKLGEDRQQVEDGEFVGGNDELAFLQFAEFG